ncbi:MAG: hypothetical protein K8H75_17550 [Sulfuricella sp.]|nr:hypothetical protein [Sulfuricella sp.]
MSNDNKLAYLYLRAAAKLSLTRAYLARKEAEYLALKSGIETMRAELAAQEGQARQFRNYVATSQS